jgi:hypothetical protein
VDDPKRRRGRPTVGERVPLGLRVTPEMKRRLDAAAKQSGRSQSQEAEFRLEGSFGRDTLIEAFVSMHDRLDVIVQLLGVQDIQRIEASAQIAGLEVRHYLNERFAQMEAVARARSPKVQAPAAPESDPPQSDAHPRAAATTPTVPLQNAPAHPTRLSHRSSKGTNVERDRTTSTKVPRNTRRKVEK